MASGSGSSSGPSGGRGEGAQGVETYLRWKHRTHFNFAVGRSTLRALPVVIHLLTDDIGWFSEDSSLFDELKRLLRDRVVSTFGDGDSDPEPPQSRKRAKKEEVCVQGERLQFTYRYRKTCPRYTVLQYADDDVEVETKGARTSSSKSIPSSAGAAGDEGSESGRPAFHHLPLSESTLLVWVYRFDSDDPYRPVPNAAALQFAPPAKSSVGEPFDVEAYGKNSGSWAGTTSAQAGPRDAGLLAWLFGPDGGDGSDGGGGGSGGRVRQHFVGSAEWQGRPESVTGRRYQGQQEEEDDIQRAIDLSLAAGGGEGRGAGEQDLVEVEDDER